MLVGAARANPVLTTLYAFKGGTDGAAPGYGSLTLYNGKLYGKTAKGGNSGLVTDLGTVFELAPPAAGKTAWTEKVISSSLHIGGSCPLGCVPEGGVTFFQGNLFTTGQGGCATCLGSVFELSPPTAGGTAWTQTLIYGFPFVGGPEKGPAGPAAGVTFDISGNLYSTTEIWIGSSTVGGDVFELSPPAAGKNAWTQTDLYNFPGANGGSVAEVILDAAGNLYGSQLVGNSAGGLILKTRAACDRADQVGSPNTGNCSPPDRPDYPVGMIGTPANAARRASIAVRPCNRPVAMTLAAAA